MPDLIYTKDNVYGRTPCRGCAGYNICNGTDSFYGCTTFRWKLRAKWRDAKHPDIYLKLEDAPRRELFIKSNI